MSSSADPSTVTVEGPTSQTAGVVVHGADPHETRLCAEEALTEQNYVARAPAPGRRHKRDYQTSTETNSAESHVEGTPSRPAAKKPTAAERPGYEEGQTVKAPTIDIDQKHADDPQYASQLAPHLYAFLRHLERMVLPGTIEPVKPAKEYEHLRELRLRSINAMYNINIFFQGRTDLQVPTDTIHLAIYYMDRFLERYTDQKNMTLGTISATALFLASKYEDVEPIDIDMMFKYKLFGKEVKESDILCSEVRFQEILHILTGPTATAFAHRYLQAVDMELNLAAVHTARYFCALGVAHFPLSGQYYSKIAAAAVFIAYNKYSPKANSPAGTSEGGRVSVIDFPEALADHSQYTPADIRNVVQELLEVAKAVEDVSGNRSRTAFRDELPLDIYHYYKKAGVVSTCILPDFKGYFANLHAEETASSSEKASDEAKPESPLIEEASNPEPAEKENPEESESN